MKVIEQGVFAELEIEEKSYYETGLHLQLNQKDDCLCVDKQGAKRLIEVLKEFVGDE